MVTRAVGSIPRLHQPKTRQPQGRADAALPGRRLPREPQWPFRARALRAAIVWPVQYRRAAIPPTVAAEPSNAE